MDGNLLTSLTMDAQGSQIGRVTQIVRPIITNDFSFGLISQTHVGLFRIFLDDADQGKGGKAEKKNEVKQLRIMQVWIKPASELEINSDLTHGVYMRFRGRSRFSVLDAGNTLSTLTREGVVETRIENFTTSEVESLQGLPSSLIIHQKDSIRQVKLVDEGAFSDSTFANCKIASQIVDFAFEPMST
jgi:hypothetical protein